MLYKIIKYKIIEKSETMLKLWTAILIDLNITKNKRPHKINQMVTWQGVDFDMQKKLFEWLKN